MTDWFRSWHGAPTDIKWLAVAKQAGVKPGMVASIVWALMDHASQKEGDERGSVDGFDAEEVALFYGYEPEEVETVCNALKRRGVLHVTEGSLRFAAWERRQPKREDNSASRVRKFRERKKAETCGTEAHETQVKRTVTQCNAPEQRQSRADTEQKDREAHASARPLPSGCTVDRSNGKEPPPPPLPEQKPGVKRGTRLPEQWEPPPEGWQMAVDALGAEGAERQLATFRDHWRAQSGQRGVKLDWAATWRNWVRRAPDFGPSARGSPVSPADKAKEREAIDRFLKNGNHGRSFGNGN